MTAHPAGYRANVWHRPQPGPMYWDYRCLRCGEDVAAHPSWWKRWLKARNDREVRP